MSEDFSIQELTQPPDFEKRAREFSYAVFKLAHDYPKLLMFPIPVQKTASLLAEFAKDFQNEDKYFARELEGLSDKLDVESATRCDVLVSISGDNRELIKKAQKEIESIAHTKGVTEIYDKDIEIADYPEGFQGIKFALKSRPLYVFEAKEK